MAAIKSRYAAGECPKSQGERTSSSRWKWANWDANNKKRQNALNNKEYSRDELPQHGTCLTPDSNVRNSTVSGTSLFVPRSDLTAMPSPNHNAAPMAPPRQYRDCKGPPPFARRRHPETPAGGTLKLPPEAKEITSAHDPKSPATQRGNLKTSVSTPARGGPCHWPPCGFRHRRRGTRGAHRRRPASGAGGGR